MVKEIYDITERVEICWREVARLREENGRLLERVKQLEGSFEALTTSLAQMLTDWRDGVLQTSPLRDHSVIDESVIDTEEGGP